MEEGSHLPLANTKCIMANNIHFPTDAQQATEKLYGWSILVDIFHGPAQDIST